MSTAQVDAVSSELAISQHFLNSSLMKILVLTFLSFIYAHTASWGHSNYSSAEE